ncbi:MAG: hypothetical protein Ct9H300mP18_08690 [Candidatus Neomarinimicrobiota bacterium]|nr:MAG: hypothetical protein Ct9H300mP18_08690 [Candidatus Neomarinimicrobiota bacterium]
MNISYGSWLNNVSNSSFFLGLKVANGNIGVNLRYMGINDLELRSAIPTDDPLRHLAQTPFLCLVLIRNLTVE